MGRKSGVFTHLGGKFTVTGSGGNYASSNTPASFVKMSYNKGNYIIKSGKETFDIDTNNLIRGVLDGIVVFRKRGKPCFPGPWDKFCRPVYPDYYYKVYTSTFNIRYIPNKFNWTTIRWKTVHDSRYHADTYKSIIYPPKQRAGEGSPKINLLISLTCKSIAQKHLDKYPSLDKWVGHTWNVRRKCWFGSGRPITFKVFSDSEWDVSLTDPAITITPNKITQSVGNKQTRYFTFVYPPNQANKCYNKSGKEICGGPGRDFE
jgi:hypothetical protein